MSAAAIEHVNLTVSDPRRTAENLCRLFGWKIRWQGPARLGGLTVHVGGDESYLAVYSYPAGEEPAFGEGRLNHVGVLVRDLDAAEARVREAGFKPFNHGAYEPGRRFYFLDSDGIEFEVVSYA